MKRAIKKDGMKKHIIGNVSLAVMALVPLTSIYMGSLVGVVVFLLATGIGIYGTMNERSWPSHSTLTLSVFYISMYLAYLAAKAKMAGLLSVV